MDGHPPEAPPVEPVVVPIPRLEAKRAYKGDGHDREGVEEVIHDGHYAMPIDFPALAEDR